MSKSIQIPRGEVNPDRVVNAVHSILHPKAADILETNATALRDWVARRIEAVHAGKESNAVIGLNAYDQTHQLGIQSAPVGLFHYGRPLQLPREIVNNHPTLGFPTPGLLNGPVHANICAFDVDSIESLDVLSPLRIGTSAEQLYQVRGLGDHVDVVRPEKAHLVLEVPGVQLETDLPAEPGAYACLFLSRILSTLRS